MYLVIMKGKASSYDPLHSHRFCCIEYDVFYIYFMWVKEVIDFSNWMKSSAKNDVNNKNVDIFFIVAVQDYLFAKNVDR